MLSSHSRATKVAIRLLLGAIASVGFASSAAAAPVNGPSGSLFYNKPLFAPGAHGTLVRYLSVSDVNVAASQPAVNGWEVMYDSQSTPGSADYVTGIVIEPKAAWTGPGARPVVDFACGTQGLAHVSAPSLQLQAGTEYEATNIVDALQKGWAVEVTDYQGYMNGGTPDYMIGSSQGHAMLDLALAAQQIPGAGISASAPVVTWGYSQGGGASAWADTLEPSYAPSLDYVGDASGGIPADLAVVAQGLNGSAFSAFLLYAIIGLEQDYPSQINLPKYENSKASNAIHTALTDNLIQATTQFALQNINLYTTTNPATGKAWTLTDLLAVPSINSAVTAQKLGATPAAVPMFEYHATADEIVPLSQGQTLNKTYCAEGVKAQWETFVGDHITGDLAAVNTVIPWINDRFNGVAAPSNC